MSWFQKDICCWWPLQLVCLAVSTKEDEKEINPMADFLVLTTGQYVDVMLACLVLTCFSQEQSIIKFGDKPGDK